MADIVNFEEGMDGARRAAKLLAFIRDYQNTISSIEKVSIDDLIDNHI
jgi:hypothetical protein